MPNLTSLGAAEQIAMALGWISLASLCLIALFLFVKAVIPACLRFALREPALAAIVTGLILLLLAILLG